ncbi:hypothetical protein AB0F81_29930 [Actinoplanes sp. NPDC024001]|uniref:hypothetical protein n=1 Tax=Actinoplanes sp. NPDC024001 TaxID=3154598 RepID=UPI0033D63EAE
MIDLVLPLLRPAATRISHSALPDAPVVPDPEPGPLRRGTAAALRRAAARLDHCYQRPVSPARSARTAG